MSKLTRARDRAEEKETKRSNMLSLMKTKRETRFRIQRDISLWRSIVNEKKEQLVKT